MKNRNRLLSLWVGLWVGLACVVVPAQTQSPSPLTPTPATPRPVSLVLMGDTTRCQFKLRINSSQVVGFDDLARSQNELIAHGVRLSAFRKGGQWRIQAIQQPATITAPELGATEVSLALDEEAIVEFCNEDRTFSITVPSLPEKPSSRVAARLRLPDGSTAGVAPNSSLRLEMLRDHSFFLIGKGAVAGKYPTGEPFLLTGTDEPVLSGLGPSRDGSTPPAASRFPAPTLRISARGTIGSHVDLEASGQSIPLAAGTSRQLSTPNGTSIEIAHDSTSRSLRLSVIKGIISFSYAEHPSATMTVISGQRVSYAWDPKRTESEFHLETAEANSTVRLQDGSVISITPKSKVRVSSSQTGTASATTVLGKATVRNPTTAELTELPLWSSPTESLPSATAKPTKVALLAGKGSDFSVRIENGTPHSFSSLVAQGGKTIEAGVAISSESNGSRWIITGDSNSAELYAASLPLTQVSLPRGHSLTVDYIESKSVLSLQSHSTNRVDSPSAQSLPTLGLSEGSKILLGTDAIVRMEAFLDGSYYVQASGSAQGVDQRGKGLRFAPPFSILTGKTKPQTEASKAEPATNPTSPETGIVLRETGGGLIEIQTEGNTIQLGPNGTRKLSSPNGTDIDISRSGSMRALRLVVNKGLVTLSPPLIAQSRVLITTGHALDLTWDPNAGSAEFRHRAGQTALTIALADQNLVSIPPDGAVKLTHPNAGQYTLQTVLGNPSVTELATGIVSPLGKDVQRVSLDTNLALSRTKLRFLPGTSSTFKIQVNGRDILGVDEANATNGRLQIEGGELQPMQGGARWLVRSRGKLMEITAAGLDPCSIEIADGEAATVSYNNTLGFLEIATAQSNKTRSQGLARIRLPDGGFADLGVYSTLHYERFTDGSFFMTANGSVQGASSDGRGFVQSGNQTPLTGIASANVGQPVASPETAIRLHISPTGQPQIAIGNQPSVTPSEKLESIKLPNGSEFEVALLKDQRSIRLRASKGYATLSFPDSSLGQAFVVTGQTLDANYDPNSRKLVLQNPESNRVGIRFPSRSIAWLSQNTLLEIAPKNGSTLQVSSSQGQATLWDATTGRISPIGKQPREMLSESTPTVLATQVDLVKAEGQGFKIRVNGKTTYGIEDANARNGSLLLEGLELQPRNNGSEWTIRALNRPAEISASPLYPVKTHLIPGERIKVRCSEDRGFLELTTEPTVDGVFKEIARTVLWDGSVVGTGPSSRARVEMFSDRTFFVAGTGSLKFTPPGGNAWMLDTATPHATGGPVSTDSTPGAPNASRRLSPKKAVFLATNTDLGLGLRFADQTKVITWGSRQTLSSKDGTSFEIVQEGNRDSATISVLKGLLEVELSGLGVGAVTVASEQSVSLEWDLSQRTLRVTQTGGDLPTRIVLPNQSAIILQPDASVAMTRQGITTLSAKVLRGRASLWDLQRRLVSDLGSQAEPITLPAEGLSADNEAPVKVLLVGSASEATSVQIDGGAIYTFDDLNPSKGKRIVDGIELTALQTGKRWGIRSIQRPAQIAATGMTGWKTHIAPGEAATFAFSPSLSTVEVTTGQANSPGSQVLALMDMPDGSRVTMGAYSSTVTDVMNDGSYGLSGSGAVRATTKEGKNFVLHAASPPLKAGATKNTPPGNRGSPLGSGSPAVLRVSGSPLSQLSAESKDQRTTLTRGVPRKMVIEGGLTTELNHRVDQASLALVTVKGPLQIDLVDFPNVHPLLGTGQSLTLAWDKSKGTFEVSEVIGERAVLIQLPNRAVALIPQGGSLSLLMESRNGYSIRSTNETASLWDPESQQTSKLNTSPRVISGPDSPLSLETKVHLLGSGPDTFAVRSNGRNPFAFDELARTGGKRVMDGLEFQAFQRGSRWRIRSLEKAAEVTAEGMGNWKAVLPLGESVTFQFSEARGLIEITTAQGSSALAQVLTQILIPDGTVFRVGPHSSVRSDLYLDGSFAISGTGSISGTAATREEFRLTHNDLPFLGAGLDPRSPATGKLSSGSKTPLTTLRLQTKSPEALSVTVNGQSIPLHPSQAKPVRLSNGTEFEMTRDTQRNALRFTVNKGYLDLAVDTAETGNLILTSGQSVEISWSIPEKRLDITQVGGERPTYAKLPDESVLAIGPDSVLRLANDRTDLVTAQRLRGLITVSEPGAETPKPLTDEKQSFRAQSSTLRRTVSVNLMPGTGKAIRVRLNNQMARSWEDANSSQGRILAEGLELIPQQQGTRWTIRSIAQDAEVIGEGLGGWKTFVHIGETVSFDYQPDGNIVRVSAEKSVGSISTTATLISLPDGSKIMLKSGASAQTDFLKDGSFVVIGQNGASAQTSRGQKFELTPERIPLYPTPTEDRSTPRADGQAQIYAAAPPTPAVLNGNTGDSIELAVGNQKILVTGGAAKQLTLPNGARLEAFHDKATGRLRISVRKGCFQFTPGTTTVGSPVLVAGQSVDLKWTANKDALEVGNPLSLTPFKVLLPNHAVLLPNRESWCLLQTEGAESFSVASTEGDAALFDPTSRQVVNVGLQKRILSNDSSLNLSQTRVHLMGGAGNSFKVRVNDKTSFSFEDAVKNQGRIQFAGLELAAAQQGARWTITSVNNAAEVTATAVSAWKATVPIGESVTLDYSELLASVDLTVGDAKPGRVSDSVNLKLPDGSLVSMNPKSRTRTELFKDGSFYLSGTGDASGSTADGRPFSFLGGSIPVGGGSLQKRQTAEGRDEIVRGSPVTATKLKGTLGGEMQLEYGAEKVSIPTTGARRLSLPNGTEVEFSQDLIRRNLRASITKGYLLFDIESAPGTLPVGVSGQTVTLMWNPAKQTLEVGQAGGSQSLMVLLPDRSFASLEAESLLRITRETGSSFSTQLLRGKASVIESSTSQLALLGPQRRLFTLTNPGSGQPTRLHLVGAGNDSFRIRVNDSRTYGIEDAAKSKGRIIVGGVQLQPLQRGSKWVLTAVSNGAELTAQGMGTWKAEMPMSESVTVSFSEPNTWIELITGNASSPEVNEILQIHLTDGATADVGPNSVVRTETFKDTSYFVSGHGSVSGSTADGKAFSLLPGQIPITGGPLVEMLDERGVKRVNRLTPLVEVVIRGTLGDSLELRTGEQSITVEPGKPNRLSLANGSEIEFAQNPTAQTLEVQVVRGMLSLSVPEIKGWRPIAQSGQQFSIQWNGNVKTADLINTTPNSSLLVLLPSRTVGTVAPNATLQYASISENSYATAAAGGRVTLINLVTRAEVSLTGENKVVENGRLSRGGMAAGTGAKEPIGLKWDFGTPLVLQGVGQDPVMQPNSEKRFRMTQTHELSISYGDQGTVNFTAIGGDFEIVLGALNGLKIEVAEGDSIMLTLDLRKGTFIATTGDSNTMPVKITTPDGTTPKLAAANSINFDVNKDGSLVGRSSDGSVLLTDVAGLGLTDGAGGINDPSRKLGTRGGGAVLTPSTELDVTKIIETPKSP